MVSLPNAEQLSKLTLRAIVAYAFRSARSCRVVLHGVVENGIVETPLRVAGNFVTSLSVNRADAATAALNVASVAEAMCDLKTRELKLAALCLTRIAMATVAAIEATASPGDSEAAKRQIALAAREAASCAKNAVDALNGSVEAIDSARSDYEVLLKHIGEHSDVLLGEPIDLSEEWWQADKH